MGVVPHLQWLPCVYDAEAIVVCLLSSFMTTNPRFERTGSLFVEYRRPREGPPSFLVYEPGKSFICLTSKELLRAVKWPKYTPTGAKLRQWIEEIQALPTSESEPEPVNQQSWGPEAHPDQQPSD